MVPACCLAVTVAAAGMEDDLGHNWQDLELLVLDADGTGSSGCLGAVDRWPQESSNVEVVEREGLEHSEEHSSSRT